MAAKRITSLVLLIIMLAVPFASLGGPSTVAEIRLKGLVGIDENKVMEVLPFKVGDEFDMGELDRGVSYLRKWGVFSTIEARTYDTAEGVVVEIVFGEAKVITSIDVVGNYPYLQNKILKYLTLHAGDLYTPKKVDEQLERIEEFYKREGYVDTTVHVDEEEIPFEGGFELTFHIRKGELIRYRNIEVTGNKAYPASRFTSKIDSFRPYSDLRLRRSIRELTEFYRMHGHPRAKITVEKKNVDYETMRADLVIHVDEGPYVKVKFKGNDNLSGRRLRKTVTIFKEGSYDSYEIEASADAIKELYRQVGYPEAQIGSETRTLKNGTIVIVFLIDEGRPHIVKNIDFEGNENVSGGKLKKAMITKQRALGHKGAFDPELKVEDEKAIKDIYRSEGYIQAEVGEWDVRPTKQGFDLDVTIPVVEGPQTIVRHIEFNGNESISSMRLRKVIKNKERKPLDELSLPADKQSLLMYYADNGRPYAEVRQYVSTDTAKDTATISYEINEGPPVRIGQVLIVGDVLTSQRAIKGAMDIKEGEPFSYKKIVESQLKLRRLGAFSAVKIETIGMADKAQTVHLLVDVDEQDPFLVDLELGYSTDNSWVGALSFTNLNAFGWAKRNKFKLSGGRKLSRAEVDWIDPSFLGSSFEMSVIGWIQHEIQPSFDYFQMGGSLGFFRRYRSWGFFFKYELDRDYFVEGDSAAADAQSLRDNTISKISLSSSYDTRDSYADPTKGWYTLGGADIFNEIGGARANFVRFNWWGENDLTFWKRLTLTTSLRFNNIITMGSNISVPTNELLFLGGADTLRGFDYQSLGPLDAAGKPTGGRVRFIWNEELRLRITRRLQGAFFLDIGSLTNDFSTIGWNTTVRKDAGFGLRYVTPVGPIRADYGIKLDRKPGESFGHFNLTFGYVF